MHERSEQVRATDRILCEQVLGSGPIKVTSKNRSLVRRWCRAYGVAAGLVETMTLAELEQCYNDGEVGARYLEMSAPDKPPKPALDVAALAQQTAQAVAVLLAPLIAQAVAEALAAQPHPLTTKQVEALIQKKLTPARP